MALGKSSSALFRSAGWLRRVTTLLMLLLLCGAPPPLLTGCSRRPAAGDSPAPHEALRRAFPVHASRVLRGSEPFVASSTGFATALGSDPAAAVGRRGGLSAALPKRAEEPVRFHLLGGMEIGVREVGASGEGALAEGTVAYPRKGGTSFWTATADGYEEWLHLGAGVATGREPVAVWEVEGASLREANGAVEVAGADGEARVWVAAPVAFAKGGRPVPTRLAVQGSRIELWADAGGEAVLVDPVWSATSPMGTSRYGHVAVVLQSGKVLVAGGYSGASYLATAEEYDPETGRWESVGPMGASRLYAAAVRLANGKVLVAGGCYVNSAELYDPATRTWAPTGAMSKARGYHAAVAVPVGAGKALVAGGYNPTDGYLNGAEVYDSETGAWSSAGPAGMNVARMSATADWLGGVVGKVLVTGGYTGSTYAASAELYDPARNTWAMTGSMASGRSNHATAILASAKVLVTGGGVDTAELYDPAAENWSTTGAMGDARYYHTATLLLSGKVLVAGGWSGAATASTATYDPATGTWTASTSMITARYYQTASPLAGKVLVAGGYTGSAALSDSEVYDPAADTWTPVGAMTSNRRYHAAALLGNGTVLVAGGAGTSGITATVQIFDPSTGLWSTSTPAMHYDRYWHTATTLGSGKVLVAGGMGTASVNRLVAELYDPATNTWTDTAALSAGRYRHTATLLSTGEVLVVGGGTASGQWSAELYDPVQETWTVKASPRTPRARHSATLLKDGSVLVAGGYNGAGCYRTAERYDPGTNTWSAAGEMSDGRSDHSAVRLDDGRVLVTGGRNGSTYIASAEIYDPVNNTWSIAAPMHVTRTNHTMTIVNDGTVVVAGGFNGTYRQEVEIYQPGAGIWLTAAPMAAAREDHTATLLGKGNILMACGQGSSGNLASAEIYSPVVIDDRNPCTTDVWDRTLGQVTHAPVANGTACNDGNPNTVGDACMNGVCVGTDHCIGVVCTALDQCHEAGTCIDHATGACSNPNKADNTPCDDSNANTTGDVCTGGMCAGVDHCVGVVCTALDQCHEAGTCVDHATGACSNPNKANRSPCDDGNPNTVGDQCTNGTCVGSDGCIGVVCAALDQCHEAGSCIDHATGACSNPNRADGAACDDGDANTTGDVCTSGVCAGVDHCIGVVCAALDQCHVAGTCDHATGGCSNPNKADGSACDDGDANTTGDLCTNGVCAGVDHCIGVRCTALDQCHDVGTCIDHATGVCSNPSKADGTACEDGNPCTFANTCQAGACSTGYPVICYAKDDCHDAGTCDPATGACSNPSKANGTPCDDYNGCTQTDTCQNGTCVGSNPMACTALDACHLAGTCDANTGACSNPAADVGNGGCDPLTICSATGGTAVCTACPAPSVGTGNAGCSCAAGSTSVLFTPRDPPCSNGPGCLTNIALNAHYTLAPDPGNYSATTDDPGPVRTKLTNGQISIPPDPPGYYLFWTQATTVGWQQASPIVITLDLGARYAIKGISYHTAGGGAAGVDWPTHAYVFIADQGGDGFHFVGDLVDLHQRHAVLPRDGSNNVAELWTDELAWPGQYVTLLVMSSTYVFVDEIKVFEGDPAFLNNTLPGAPVTTFTQAAAQRPELEIYADQRAVTDSARLRIVNDMRSIVFQSQTLNVAPDLSALLNCESEATTLAVEALPDVGPDFRTTLPLNALHARVLTQKARLWQAQGWNDVRAWPGSTWDRPAWLADPPSVTGGTIHVDVMRGEHRAALLNVANATLAAKSARLRIRDTQGAFDPAWVHVHQVAWTDTAFMDPVADALSVAGHDNNGYIIDLPAGVTRQVWLDIQPTGVAPGTYTYAVDIDGVDTGVELTVTVHAFDLPTKPRLHVAGWDYADGGAGYAPKSTNMAAYVKVLRDHAVDVAVARATVVWPWGGYDEDSGHMTTLPLTADFDAWVQRWPNASRYQVFMNGLGLHGELLGFAPGTPQFNNAVADWAKFWLDHAKLRGIDPSRVNVQLFDEPYLAEHDGIILAWTLAIESSSEIQGAGGWFRIWEDIRWSIPANANPAMIASCDTLAPSRDVFEGNPGAYRLFLQQQLASGKEVEFYEASSPIRRLDPYAYFRVLPWFAWREGGTGVGYWSFGYNGSVSSWNEYALGADPPFTPLFIDDVGVASSKHMEAVREGVEDYEYLLMLSDAINSAQQGPCADTAPISTAQVLLATAPNAVVSAAGTSRTWTVSIDRTKADQQRAQILDYLNQLQCAEP